MGELFYIYSTTTESKYWLLGHLLSGWSLANCFSVPDCMRYCVDQYVELLKCTSHRLCLIPTLTCSICSIPRSSVFPEFPLYHLACHVTNISYPHIIPLLLYSLSVFKTRNNHVLQLGWNYKRADWTSGSLGRLVSCLLPFKKTTEFCAPFPLINHLLTFTKLVVVSHVMPLPV